MISGAERTVSWLRAFAGTPLELLTALRFQTVGHDPLSGGALNVVVEQLNQTFTILVSLRAVEGLTEMHPEANGFRFALATSSGRDIESMVPDLVAGEVFSATHPDSNQKLKKDIARLASDPARYRYAFFAAPNTVQGGNLNSRRRGAWRCIVSSSDQPPMTGQLILSPAPLLIRSPLYAPTPKAAQRVREFFTSQIKTTTPARHTSTQHGASPTGVRPTASTSSTRCKHSVSPPPPKTSRAVHPADAAAKS